MRVRKTSVVLGWVSALLIVLGGCGSSTKGHGIPEQVDREVPSKGVPDERDPWVDEEGDAGPAPMSEEVPCCNVTFALADESDEEEQTAALKGPNAPLDGDGYPLVYANGAWTATVCMPINYNGTYYYEFGVTPDEGEVLFINQRTNQFVPTVVDETYGLVNFFSEVEACEDITVDHAQISED